MKKILSFVLVAVMLITMLPVGIAADSAEKTYLYKFFSGTHGQSNKTDFSPSAFSVENTADGYDKWGYVGACFASGWSFNGKAKTNRSDLNFTAPKGTTAPPEFTEEKLAAFCFEIEAEEGTYTPRVAWVNNETGTTVSFYLIEKPAAGVLDTDGAFDTVKFKNYIFDDNFEENLIGYGDFSLKGGRRLNYTGESLSDYNNITNKHGKTMQDVTLNSSDNRYYLIAVMTGKGAEAQSSGNTWGTTLLAFSLTPANGTNTVGDINTVCSVGLSVLYPEGEEKLPRGESAKLDFRAFGGFEENPQEITLPDGEFEITYTSSNEKVLTVSDDGIVTGGSRNGIATVTAKLEYNGTVKETSCNVTVWSPVKYAAVVTTLRDSTLAVGEITKILSTVPKREDGTDADMEDSVISYSIPEEDSEIIRYDEKTNSVIALSEGTGTLITTITASGGITTSENKITVDNLQKVEKVYLYCDESIPIGKTAQFKTSLELKNGSILRGGEVVSLEIISESEEGVVLLDEEDCSVIGTKPGTVEIRAKVMVRGVEHISDTAILTVTEFGKYAKKNFSIDFRSDKYVGDSFETLDKAVEYTDHRNWVFHEISAIGDYNKNLLLRENAFCYVVFNITNSDPYLAFRVRFSESGKYAVDTCTYNCYRSANTEMYVMPANAENLADISSMLVKGNEYYVGSLDFYSENAIDNATARYGFANVPEAGEYLVVMKIVPGKAQEIKYFNGDVFYGHYITFTHDSVLDHATLSFSKNTETLPVGESAETVFSMFGGSGNTLEHNAETLATLKYTSSNTDIATVDDNGRVTAISEGTADITASVSRDGITKEAILKVKTEDLSGISENGVFASSDGSVYIYGETQLVVSALMNSGKTAYVPAEFVRWEILPESDEDVLEISENGIATGKNIGKAHLKAHILPGWKDGSENIEIAPITIEVVFDASIELTIHTQKERDNAKRNASRYNWAKDEVEAAKQKADKYVENAELLYQIMAPEGIPRYYYIGHNYDPNKYYCRYCGANIGLEYGTYGFMTDPISRPWKVQCPDCKRLFPSNDFGSFYELGLSEDRTYWNYTDALQRHHEIFVCEDGENCTHTPPAENAPEPGSKEWMDNDPRDAAWREYYGYNVEGGFLTNILYEEMDEELGVAGWGVDDGFGYHQPYIADKNLPGYSVMYSNADGYARYTDGSDNNGPVNYYFIGYYIHEGLWHGGTVTAAINALTDAFVYTGDAKYGRAGAIILDKIADIYPKFDSYKWANWRGNEYRGTMVDPIWGTNIATSFAAAYDAFKPIYNDPYVVNYLSENGVTYKEENGELVIDNPKSSPGALKKNVEDRILRQIYEFALYGDLKGNFGRHQGAVATAAVALNKMPETGEMLEWIMQSGANVYNTGEKRHKISGGDIMNTLVANVDHDGFGNENSPQYNRTWVNNLATVADCLDGYELYPSSDLYNNPIFARMAMASHRLTLGGYYTAQTGDHGAFADKSVYLSDGVLERIFEKTKDVEIAQVLYLNNGNSVEGLHGSLLDDEPEKMTDEIKSIIDEYGTLNLDSELLSGYGFAALRAGGAYDSAVSAGRMNNHRDFALYFGSTDKHGHSDTLNLYMSAFGLNMAPDLGYPEQTGTQPNRIEWVDATISHNTVIVNEASQLPNTGVGKVHHFDDSGKVQVMDVSSDSYPVTDDYRRTFFMIEASDGISYGVDFFHIKGGNDHMYSFHSQSDELSAVGGLSGLTSYPTYEKDGKLIGTYAGADVAYGACPKDENDNYLYPEGYTWLKNVRTYNVAEEKFSVEFMVKDWNKALKDNRDLRLRLTMLNDDTPEEVSFVTGLPPQIAANKKIGEIEYMLVRNKGTDIDTTFNAVYEPYEKGNEYISAIEKVDMERSVGKPGFTDSYGAVKVTLKSGRVDYIIYSTNTNADYVVDNKIRFRGFGGVISLETKGETETVVYSYLNDGEVLSLITEQQENRFPAAYTGEVVSFTKVLATENSIVYTPDAVTDTSAITGKNVYIENDGITNAVYKIEHAEILEDGNIELHLGNTSLIRSYRDSNDITLGYNYSIAEGQTLRIPMTNTYDTSPEIENVADVSTSVGSTIVIPLSVTSEKEVQIIGTNLPRGMTIDRETMTLRWKPDASQVGDNHVAVTASDGTLETTIHFTVIVYGSTTGSSGATGEPPSTGGSGAPAGGGGGATPTPDDSSADAAGEDVSALPNDEETTQSDKGENVPDASGETDDIRFTDLGDCEWAADAINALAAENIIRGTTSDTYSPANNITRADFALLLVRTFGLKSDNTENFADVSASDYFASELAIARNTGIVGGIGENKYAPRNNITRQDMMLIVYRALQQLNVGFGVYDEPKNEDFSTIAEYAKPAVTALIGAGIVNGKSGRIAPLDYTTRAEVAVLIKRILDLG